MMPWQVTAADQSTGSPSTENGMAPMTRRWKPVAVTIRSASSVSPDASWMPPSVNVSMVSVTTDARPSLMAANRSPSGSRQIRCLPGG